MNDSMSVINVLLAVEYKPGNTVQVSQQPYRVLDFGFFLKCDQNQVGFWNSDTVLVCVCVYMLYIYVCVWVCAGN